MADSLRFDVDTTQGTDLGCSPDKMAAHLSRNLFGAVTLRRMLFERLCENQADNIPGKRPVKLARSPCRLMQLQETATAELNSIITRG